MAKALLGTRYKTPDEVYQDVADTETALNKVDRGIQRLQTAAIAGGSSGQEAEGPRGLKVRQYITVEFSGEGPQPKRDYAQWRTEWREAEKTLKARRGTAADFFNRLLLALEGRAKGMAQEFRDRKDPYKEAMKCLGREFGDDINLALECLKPVRDPKKAVDAAERAWERLQGMEAALEKTGVSIRDILWHRAALAILPPNLHANKRWDSWVEKQRRHYSQNQAASGKKPQEGKEHSTCARDLPVSQAFQSAVKTAVQKTEDAGGSPPTLSNTYLIPLPAFHPSSCFCPDQVARFLHELGEDMKSEDLATAPGFAAAEADAPRSGDPPPKPRSLPGCLKCGRSAEHRTDKCPRVGGMSDED